MVLRLAAPYQTSSGRVPTGTETSTGEGRATQTYIQVMPIPGSSNPSRVQDNTAAGSIKLAPKELKSINDILASAEITGGRYPQQADSILVSAALSSFIYPVQRASRSRGG